MASSSGNSPPAYSLCWNYGGEKEDPIHRIHSYPAKFPAFITTNALEYAKQQGVDVKVVADVFCGCGTSAVEAIKSGKSFWGCDINPVAALIAKVKTHHFRDSTLIRYLEAIKEEYCRAAPAESDYARVTDRIRYWFDDTNIKDLIRLDKAIRCQTSEYSMHRKFFLCGFSNILKPTSRWLTKSIKPQLDPGKSPRKVLEAFEEQFILMQKANQKNVLPTPGKIRIRTQNFLSSRDIESKADLIVTSPPYVTSYNYADIHQLSTMWLRYVSDYRHLRKNMLGNQYGIKAPAEEKIKELGSGVWETYSDLQLMDPGKAHSVARYCLDINAVAAKCKKILNPNGMAVFVIGNTQYKGVKIDNAMLLENCMERAKFRDVETFPRKISLKIMTPYRDERGRFTQDSTQRKVYADEFVVVGRG